MTDTSDPRRDALEQFLQSQGPPTDDGTIQPGALLTGWAVVVEWMDTDGDKALTRAHSAAAPRWAANGMWHEALYGDWNGEQ